MLMAGWVAGSLGWRLTNATARDDVTEAAAEVGGGDDVAVTLRSVANESLHLGELLSMRIAGRAGRRAFGLTIERDPGGDPHAHVTIELGEGRPVRQRLPLPRMGDPDLLVKVLLGSLRDPVFHRALASAIPLLEAAP
jgi:hypothetical protein